MEYKKEVKAFFMKEYPFLAYCFTYISIEESESIKSLVTDGRDIVVNPDYLSRLSFPETCAAFAHEILHICWEHVPRFKHFEDEKNWHQYFGLWNLAADVKINQILMINGFEIGKIGYTHKNFNISESALRRMKVEDIYTIFKERGYEFIVTDLNMKPTLTRLDWNEIRKEALQLQKLTNKKMYGLSDEERGLWRRAIRSILDDFKNPRTTPTYSSINTRFPDGIFGLVMAGEEEYSNDEVIFVLDISGSMSGKILSEEDVKFVVREVKKRGFRLKVLLHDEDVYENKIKEGSEGKSTLFSPVLEYINMNYIDPLVIWRTDGDYKDKDITFPPRTKFVWLLTRRIPDKFLPGKHIIL